MSVIGGGRKSAELNGRSRWDKSDEEASSLSRSNGSDDLNISGLGENIAQGVGARSWKDLSKSGAVVNSGVGASLGLRPSADQRRDESRLLTKILYCVSQ